MLKHEFLNLLDAHLAQLPLAERQKSLSFYAEMIDDRVEDGMTEEEAVAALGDISELAKQILLETPWQTLIKTKMPRRQWAAWEIVLLIAGAPIWLSLLVAFFAVVFSVYVSVWAVIISLFAAIFSIIVAGLVLVIASFVAIASGPWWVTLLGAGLALIGAGVLTFMAMVGFSKVLIKGTVLMGKGIKSLFIRKEREYENVN
ncbi:MAG: DUF1700 domain-containing protein [Clostridiales bacterium]|nr:DUF1700 domain-containing protein [Clostridiales bacterium]